MALFGKPRARDVVALSVDAGEVRYLSTKGDRVDKWGAIPVSPGLVSDGLINNAIEMGKLLSDLFDAEELERKRVIVGLTAVRSIPRLLVLPKLQASLMAETISREARKEMPVSLENLYLSWVSMPGNGDQQRIYLLGVPRELVDGFVRTLEAAGIPPYVMDLKPLALIRAVAQSEAIIVNLEEDALDIVLVVDYLPAIMRSFALGVEDTNPQARLDRLVGELTQTVRFYNDSHRDSSLPPGTPVYVTGRLLDNHEALRFLQGALERNVERPLPNLTCPPELPALAYMTCIGLASKRV